MTSRASARRALTAATFALIATGSPVSAGNPIVANQGVNDPHIHVFGDTAYLYASHDKSARNADFIMEDWQVWSSTDLVNWTLRSTLSPEETYLREEPGFASAWATDIAEKNGLYYWYFSEANRQTGVVIGDSPVGPWRDPLGGPLLTEDLTPTHEYDPGLFAQGDDRYIIFGVWDYYLARLGDDMVSLAEEPQRIEIRGAQGPYTFAQGTPYDGRLTDDKPFLHYRGGLYYLSWGAFYATSEDLYGPYDYRGVVLTEASFPTGLSTPTWPVSFQQGRHGSFFSWHGQDYFAYCDISQSGNRYFRDTFISYVHYRADGSIAPIRVDLTGVGEYDAQSGVIEAEEFFANSGFAKQEDAGASNGFVALLDSGSGELTFPNIRGLGGKDTLLLHMMGAADADFTLSVRREGASAPIVRHALSGARQWRIPLGALGETESLVIALQSDERGRIALDAISFE
ncbi:family 43 glycosylhydrolase [Aurantiacibacter marinus]|uniref:family 43 glycosylhydrolase n=1 Tax=Aurantiacibacter marinus TaxID=874156 RepID=UPI0012E0838E|nr:family 43 glycosylhydrolase [Aurantiacibacter marinus]